jgi:hypothetical protein
MFKIGLITEDNAVLISRLAEFSICGDLDKKIFRENGGTCSSSEGIWLRHDQDEVVVRDAGSSCLVLAERPAGR